MQKNLPVIDSQLIDATMMKFVQQKQLAGLQVLVADREQVLHRQCYGYRHLYQRNPMTDNTIFRIFSMTKPITSLGVMMLWEEGCFALDEPISSFLPSFRQMKVYNPDGPYQPLSRQLTFHDLLTHTSGLGYGLDQSSPVEKLYAKANILDMNECLSDKVARIATLPLHHQPGERFTYSVATDILGHLVELISGKALDIFLKERIFDPLQMTETGFSISKAQQSQLANLYTKLNDLPLMDVRFVPNFLRPTFLRGAWVKKTCRPAFLSGGGGLVSTMDDYSRFVRMLFQKGQWDGRQIISQKTYETMTSPQLLPHQNSTQGLNLGYGVSVLTDPEKAHLPASCGSIGGSGAAGTDFWIDPVRGLFGILMVQYVSYQYVPVAVDFARAVLANVKHGSNDESE
jgi:CubicO group peptidase (beta-lactamase class C family)